MQIIMFLHFCSDEYAVAAGDNSRFWRFSKTWYVVKCLRRCIHSKNIVQPYF